MTADDNKEISGVEKIHQYAHAQGVKQGEYNALARVRHLLDTAPLTDVADYTRDRLAELTKH